MYSLFGQSGSSSLLSSGGVVEDAMVVDQGPRVNPQELHTRRQHHCNNRDVRHNSENSSRSDQERETHRHGQRARCEHDDEEIVANFEEFLHCRAGTSREMVAQNMAQSYEQLFHTSQESEEFISLEELGPHVHQQDHRSQAQRVSTSNTTAHLYSSNQNQQDPTANQQQRTYYNLSSAMQE